MKKIYSQLIGGEPARMRREARAPQATFGGSWLHCNGWLRGGGTCVSADDVSEALATVRSLVRRSLATL